MSKSVAVLPTPFARETYAMQALTDKMTKAHAPFPREPAQKLVAYSADRQRRLSCSIERPPLQQAPIAALEAHGRSRAKRLVGAYVLRKTQVLDAGAGHMRHDRFARIDEISIEGTWLATPRVFERRVAAGERGRHGPIRNVAALEGVRLKFDEPRGGDRAYLAPRHRTRLDVGNLGLGVQSRRDERDGFRSVFLQQREGHVVEVSGPVVERQHDGSRRDPGPTVQKIDELRGIERRIAVAAQEGEIGFEFVVLDQVVAEHGHPVERLARPSRGHEFRQRTVPPTDDFRSVLPPNVSDSLA